ncbi:MAG: hypothetical protein HYV09_22670 [Deltaproteobacteria bacterium]|nr:hypothetical protein [Deltaproteobacteria bacterium]
MGAQGALLDRATATLLVTIATPIAIVVLLGNAALLTPQAVLVATGALAAVGWTLAGARARAATLRDAAAFASVLRLALFGGTWSLAAWTGLVAALIAAIAAWLLPPWAWDALGYHLPLVHDALLTERLRVVPTHIPYVNVYPHLADLYVVWFRASLPDDTWIELAQLPFAALAVLASAAIAARAGVRTGRALGLSLTFLSLPAVALQLAANYVDIAYAALLVAAIAFLFARRLTTSNALLGALSLGLLLGTKPSAPVPFALIVAAMVAHGRALRRPAWIAALAALIGGATYLDNLVRHGNPVWPVQMKIGPIELPGLSPASYFFDLGLSEPVRSYGWAGRLITSLYQWPARAVYDMRLGGFGPLVGWVLLPLALVFVLRRRAPLARVRVGLLVLAAVSLATPAAFWTRYTLAFAAALLAIFAVGSETISPPLRRASELVVAGAAALGLWIALPGFTDHRVSLIELLRLRTADERAARFGGIDGHESAWIAARTQAAPGEAIAYDRSLGLPGRLWDGRGATRVVYVGDLDTRGVADALLRERVRIAALGADTAEQLALAGVQLEALFACRDDGCTVYRLKDERLARAPRGAPAGVQR